MARATRRPGRRMRGAAPRRTTLLALVRHLQDRLGLDEDEVVETALRLVNEGRVVLTGNFAGQRLSA